MILRVLVLHDRPERITSSSFFFFFFSLMQYLSSLSTEALLECKNGMHKWDALHIRENQTTFPIRHR